MAVARTNGTDCRPVCVDTYSTGAYRCRSPPMIKWLAQTGAHAAQSPTSRMVDLTGPVGPVGRAAFGSTTNFPLAFTRTRADDTASSELQRAARWWSSGPSRPCPGIAEILLPQGQVEWRRIKSFERRHAGRVPLSSSNSPARLAKPHGSKATSSYGCTPQTATAIRFQLRRSHAGSARQGRCLDHSLRATEMEAGTWQDRGPIPRCAYRERFAISSDVLPASGDAAQDGSGERRPRCC